MTGRGEVLRTVAKKGIPHRNRTMINQDNYYPEGVSLDGKGEWTYVLPPSRTQSVHVRVLPTTGLTRRAFCPSIYY